MWIASRSGSLKSHTWATQCYFALASFIFNTCVKTSQLLPSVDCEARDHDIWPLLMNKAKHFPVQSHMCVYIYVVTSSAQVWVPKWITESLVLLLTRDKMLYSITDHKSCRDVQAIKGKKRTLPEKSVPSAGDGLAFLFFHYTIQGVILFSETSQAFISFMHVSVKFQTYFTQIH